MTKQSFIYINIRLPRFARNDGKAFAMTEKRKPLRPCGTPPLNSGGFRTVIPIFRNMARSAPLSLSCKGRWHGVPEGFREIQEGHIYRPSITREGCNDEYCHHPSLRGTERRSNLKSMQTKRIDCFASLAMTELALAMTEKRKPLRSLRSTSPFRRGLRMRKGCP